MAEAPAAHSTNIEEWAHERGLAISAPNSTITLFALQFAQSNIHPQVTLNNSILSLERTPCILGVTFDPHFKFNAHFKSLVTRALPRINILKALTGTNWGQLRRRKPYLSTIGLLSGPFSWMQLPLGSSTPHLPIFRNSKLSKTLPSAVGGQITSL